MTSQPAARLTETCGLSRLTLRKSTFALRRCRYYSVFLSINQDLILGLTKFSMLWALQVTSPSLLFYCTCVYLDECVHVTSCSLPQRYIYACEDHFGCIPQAPSTFVLLACLCDWLSCIWNSLWSVWVAGKGIGSYLSLCLHLWDGQHALSHLTWFHGLCRLKLESSCLQLSNSTECRF